MGSEILKDTLNSVDDAVTVHDSDYNIVFANTAAKRLLNTGSLQENKCYRLYHGLDSPPDFCPSCKCWDTEKETVVMNHEPHKGYPTV